MSTPQPAAKTRRNLPATYRQKILMDALHIHYTKYTTREEASEAITEKQNDDPEWDRHPFDID